MQITVTAMLGVPGSASTWIFNVVRELQLIRYGSERVSSFYQDTVERVWRVVRDYPELDRSLVWKLHEPDCAWRPFLDATGIPLIVSIRDPRDAMLSLVDRFGESKERAFQRVSATLQRVMESQSHGHILLRYEDRFFDRPETIDTLANYLGVSVPIVERNRISTVFSTDSVRQFSEHIDTLPPSRVKGVKGSSYDEVTQIHAAHIGDQRVGKWRERFSEEECNVLNVQFAPFLKAFKYCQGI